MRSQVHRAIWLASCLTLLSLSTSLADESGTWGIAERVPWTGSRVLGSPEPPLPYTTEPFLKSVPWNRPIYAKAEPGTGSLLVIQQGGESDRPARIFRVAESETAGNAKSLLEVTGRLVYGMAFHPDYERNGHLYIFSNGPTGASERQNRISRFTVNREGNRGVDPTSELVVIQWRSAGHDGGELAFGTDGMLYISTGDGTSDSDTWLSAQDISNLNGGVLRIDVGNPTPERPYSIPADNPFVDLADARGEIWAFGLRNPWRLWADTESGQIWVGNNGQDLWETVHLIRRGENYGWSVYEGSHPFYLNRQRGPAPIVPPTIEHHHTEARSMTGGVVYRGDRHPELEGAYIYGDYSTGKIWGARHDGTRISWHQELADTTHQIAGFAISPSTELLVVDHGGGLQRLKKSAQTSHAPAFPRRLSETGLFVSVPDHQVQPGVIPYSVNALGWNDGAVTARYLGLPPDEQITFTTTRGWNFPNGTVVMQTLSLPENALGVERRIETRLLTRQQNEWVGYAYRWNDEQTDALLVASAGEDVVVTLPGDQPNRTAREQVWHIPSRAECMSCHSRAVNFVLGLSTPQLNRDHDYGTVIDNQLRVFAHIGLFKEDPPSDLPRLVDPYDPSEPIEDRARSYLHVNCSCCHVEAGGGNARMELEFDKSLESMRLLHERPQHATFNIPNAMLVAPGEPEQSVLYQRLSRRGRGQMPPLMSNAVDAQAAELIYDWIKSMPKPARTFIRAWTPDDLAGRLDELTSMRSLAGGRAIFRQAGCIQCHRFNDEGGGAGPSLTGIGDRLKPTELLESILEPSARVAQEYASTMLVTADGTAVEGRIERETDGWLMVRTSGSFGDPVRIHKSEIEQRRASAQSIMPSGMLNAHTAEQILDLLAYLIANGEPTHPAFRTPTR